MASAPGTLRTGEQGIIWYLPARSTFGFLTVLERPTRCKMALPRTDHEAYRSVGCPVAGMFLAGMFRGRYVRPRLTGMLPIPT